MVTITKLVAISLVCWFTAAAGEESHCSLVIRVLSPDGEYVDAVVRVVEESGRAIEKENEQPGIRFCDLGIRPVNVIVGLDSTCNQVTVRNVPLDWGKEYHLTITYDLNPCLHHPPPPPEPLCEILLRVADSKQGHWIPGAVIEFSTPSVQARTTDEYGRAFLVVRAGSEVQARVKAVGYKPQEIRPRCQGRGKIEHHVLLQTEGEAQ